VIAIKLDDAAWDDAQDNAQALLEKWLVAENEKVKKGQVLVTVVMVKATIDIEAPADGHIEKIMIANGESFALGAILATFVDADPILTTCAD
jgi:pyruvate/2-oxoglutarate dehydrogenase complex dihydrolipoamide acyltransferase (E2) component